MKTEAEIRMAGMQALIDALGLVETERFLMAVSREAFDYTEWRRHHLPAMPLKELARLANAETKNLRKPGACTFVKAQAPGYTTATEPLSPAGDTNMPWNPLLTP